MLTHEDTTLGPYNEKNKTLSTHTNSHVSSLQ
jgi:hypothetical protein